MPEDDGIYFDSSYDMSDGDVGTLDFGTFPDFSTNSDFGPAYDMKDRKSVRVGKECRL